MPASRRPKGTFSVCVVKYTLMAQDMERSGADGGGTVRSGPEDRGDEAIFLAELTDREENGFMMSQPRDSVGSSFSISSRWSGAVGGAAPAARAESER